MYDEDVNKKLEERECVNKEREINMREMNE